MFFDTAKCRANSRRLWSGGGGKSDAVSVPAIQQTPENRDVKRFRGWRLFQLALCKPILNTFVYEIYQRVFELSVKHTLSDFLLPFCCHKYTINLLINQDLIWATKVSFIFLFKSLIFLNWETFISLTITSCNLSGMSAETNSRYLVII